MSIICRSPSTSPPPKLEVNTHAASPWLRGVSSRSGLAAQTRSATLLRPRRAMRSAPHPGVKGSDGTEPAGVADDQRSRGKLGSDEVNDKGTAAARTGRFSPGARRFSQERATRPQCTRQTLRCSWTTSSVSWSMVPPATDRPFSMMTNSLATRRANGSFCSTSSIVTPASRFNRRMMSPIS